MRHIRPLVLALLVLAVAAPAYADLTFIVGANQTPSSRSVKGFALGGGGMIATEFEYANNGENVEEQTPGLRTFMGNLLLQTPFVVAGFQPYATAGIGYYRERLEMPPVTPSGPVVQHQESAMAFNSGVGVKVRIFGPLMARADYRVLKLRGEPLYSTVHRVYSGIHLAF
jgi:opacity protein-like surface antigen